MIFEKSVIDPKAISCSYRYSALFLQVVCCSLRADLCIKIRHPTSLLSDSFGYVSDNMTHLVSEHLLRLAWKRATKHCKANASVLNSAEETETYFRDASQF